MSVGIINRDGGVRVHHHRNASPAALLQGMARYRDDLAMAVACRFPWYWVADRCAQAGIAVVLGPALDMQAIHGGQATNDNRLPTDGPHSSVKGNGGWHPASIHQGLLH